MLTFSQIRETVKGILHMQNESEMMKTSDSNSKLQIPHSSFKRMLVIGDIHGNYDRFKSLWSKLEVTDEDFVIFLGDYIDRGNDNLLMLRWIMRESQRDNIIALRGNHEQMMIDFYRNGDINWIFNGGNRTGAEIREKQKEHPELLNEVLEFVEALPLYYRLEINGRYYYFCHAGVDPSKSLEDQDEMSLLWIREKFLKNYDGDTIIVAGHTPILLLNPEGSLEFWCRDTQAVATKKDIKPLWRRNGKILLMDTGSYFPNGCISCIDLLTNKIYNSD